MNFLMWFGNTTILLMAGIMGIDQSLFEAANIDGASSLQVFFKVTLPLLMPILVYTVITALIGGLRCAAGADQWAWHTEPHLDNARHVP